MNKLILEGLDSLNINDPGIKISFLCQSCFPIYLVSFKNQKIAVKILDRKDIAASEISGLKYLQEKNCHVPGVIGSFTKEKNSLIYLEFISEKALTNKKDKLLSALLNLYSNRNAKWGFGEDNFIGTLPQKNSYHDSFDSFFWQNRVEPQLRLCMEKKIFSFEFTQKIEKLVFLKIQEWKINSYTPRLIHGDLWNGNILFGEDVYFIDPSISYSHPEQDIAMLELFGSPLNPLDIEFLLEKLGCDIGFKERIPFWQLYPLLVHVNLFGGNYPESIKKIINFYE